jgi:hypothetical protein
MKRYIRRELLKWFIEPYLRRKVRRYAVEQVISRSELAMMRTPADGLFRERLRDLKDDIVNKMLADGTILMTRWTDPETGDEYIGMKVRAFTWPKQSEDH